MTSDWGAVHSPLAITDGLDLEMPGRPIAGRPGGPHFTEALKAAVQTGAVPVSALDQALARILVQMDRFHLLDGKPRAAASDRRERGSEDRPQHRHTKRRAA